MARKPRTPPAAFHFTGDEQPDLMTDEDIAISDRVFDELGRKWHAEDTASGRIKLPKARKRRSKQP
jgi:hypothetical protein